MIPRELCRPKKHLKHSINAQRHLYESTLLQGFDIEGEDPREVVQNILFGEHYAAVKEDMAIVSLVNLFHLKHVSEPYCVMINLPS